MMAIKLVSENTIYFFYYFCIKSFHKVVLKIENANLLSKIKIIFLNIFKYLNLKIKRKKNIFTIVFYLCSMYK